jgi:metal-responsive CopG/Arc/MetJ family transcriptional regulator
MQGSVDDLIAFSHQHYSVVVATLQAALDAIYCLEVLVL